MLLDRFGKPYRLPEGLQRSRLRNTARADVWQGITPERMAQLFTEADRGLLGSVSELYSVIRRVDGHTFCETQKRVQSILTLEDSFTPASSEQQDVEICDFVRETLSGCSEWADLKETLNLAVMTGVSAVEVIWGRKGGMIVPLDYKRIPLHCLSYSGIDGSLTDWPLYLDDQHPTGAPLARDSVLLHCGNALQEHPVRQGAFRPIAWMVMLKHYSMRDWWRFGESYGIPMRIGKYDMGTSEQDRAMLYEAVQLLGSDGAAVISKDAEIALIEAASGSTAVSFYDAQTKACNAEISKAAVGVTLTTEVGVDGGSRAAADTHLEVQQDLTTGDGLRLAGTIKQQLIKRLVEWNFGLQAALPNYALRFSDQVDYQAKAAWLEQVANRVPIEEEEYYRQYGLTPPAAGAKTVGGGGAGGGFPMFASRTVAAKAPRQMTEAEQRQQEILKLAQQASSRRSVVEGFKENQRKIVEAVRKSASYEEAMDAVAALSGSLDNKGLEDAIASAFLSARLYGRNAVKLK